MRNDSVNKYYRELKALFPLKTYYEIKFLKEFKNSLIEFSGQISNCTYDDLCKEFGTPQEIFLEYMNTEDYENEPKTIWNDQIRKNIIAIVSILLIIGIVIYFLFLSDLKNKVEQSIPYETETTITEY
ncbi:hypothetical protein H6A32_15315 [Drancourtella massiliensis]|uniref:Helix-turn-helix domain-containing protein n=1 Tax=Drancourtella massiliensis TaxID=1632013 RepID=A0ABS2ELE4_9FIRM|nr:DUF6120 family protein [Drancourtella massiliensis]MBM6745632.1 hypothetical protein [Drancourtella massiliensis]